jgi:ABC-type phosphate transport system substrate-binding protein
MIRRRSSWLGGVIACALLVAGCGGGSSTTASQSAKPSATSSTTPGTGSSTTAPSATKVAQAIAACKAEIRAQSTLPASAKSKLEGICSKVAKGDRKAVRAVAREVCEEVIHGASLPAGPSREQALAACRAK